MEDYYIHEIFFKPEGSHEAKIISHPELGHTECQDISIYFSWFYRMQKDRVKTSHVKRDKIKLNVQMFAAKALNTF